MTRSIPLSVLFTSLLGLTVAIGCGDKDDDTGDDGTTDDGGSSDGGGDDEETECDDGEDNDNDGDVDCDDADCSSDDACDEPDFMEVTGMQISWSDAIVESAHGTVTYSGTPLPSEFYITLSTDDWAGDFNDTDEYCQLAWPTDAAEVSTTCTNCWAGLAWSVDSSVAPDLYGGCDTLDPDDYGDISEYFAGFDFVYGYGADQEGITDLFLNDYGWGDAYGIDDTHLWGAYAYSDAFGLSSSTLPSNQWGIGYAWEIDKTGELVTDGTSFSFAAVEGPFPPDGQYSSIGAYYFPVE